MSDSLDRLAEAYGIEHGYVSETGEHRLIGEETKRSLLRVMGVNVESEEQIAAALAAIAGVHSHKDALAPTGKCFVPEWLEGGRCWGVACQLYSLRSQRNHGIGDFEDLARLAEIIGSMGADFIGVSPLHALFWSDPGRCSPYSPSTRRFLNPLYIAADAVEGSSEALAGIDADVRALRTSDTIDYRGVARLKRAIFEETFVARKLDCDGFARFREEGGDALKRFAEFEALSEAMTLLGHGGGWQGWPREFQDCRTDAVARFSAENAARVLFHQWLQWLAAEQLLMAQRRARASGMRIGLYLDLAIGVASDGMATWADPGLIVAGARVGAPPDLFNAKGQDWGLAPMSPNVLSDRNLEPFAEDVAALMRYAGAIRIDHVMGLERLYWIPAEADARAGGYVGYPLRQLLACLTELSQAFEVIVVGEDLGTVRAGLRDVMREAEIQSHRVLYFERREDRAFLASAHYPAGAVACLATHDLPTLKGWWLGRDIAARSNIGLYSPAEATRAGDERAKDRRRLLAVLSDAGLADEAMRRAAEDPSPSQLPTGLPSAIHHFLARTPSRLLALQLEDLVGVPDQINLPGTRTEYANWRRKLPADLASLATTPSLLAITAVVCEERPREQ